MGFRRNLGKMFAAVFIAATGIWQCAYWMEAVKVAENVVVWDGKPYWISGGPGSFLPWPREPGMLTVMTPMKNLMDQIIFYLIRTWLFVPIAMGIIVLFGYTGWRIGES